ncbi:F-box/kelch-repeat protein At3g23880-like [Lycium ferocissimum]|uniref:F-box/kelch-repeat protein At3g23880-like n=1 Tax=Lycium ferocissimum TaxID=112874 RepID=UPI0028150FDF|nr:F-box/kelch-repeat protein At3g23880-like [Lycium ferocissimum]
MILILPFLTLVPELNTEILSRLPVSFLLQIKSVSKSWLAFISSPEFIKAHLSISADNKEYTNHRLMLRFYQPKYNLKDCSLRAKDLCIWNPSIRKHRKLPNFTTNFRDCFIYGFGYDKLHGDYKVVGCIFDNSSLDKVEVKIYSQKSDSWRSIQNLPNGLKCFGSGLEHHCFDLTDEKWKKVEQPCYGEKDGVLVLGVLGNNLSVICNGNRQRTDLDVWVRKEYGVKQS